MRDSLSLKALTRTAVAAATAQSIGLAYFVFVSLDSSAVREYLADEPTWVLVVLALMLPLLSAVGCTAVFLARRGRLVAALAPAAIAVYGQGAAVFSAVTVTAEYGSSWFISLLGITSTVLFGAVVASLLAALLSMRRRAAA